MREFFKKMMGGGDEVSSKRVAALFTLLNIIALAWVAAFKNTDFIAPQFMYETLGWIVAGGLGLAAAEKIFGNKKKDGDDTTNPPVI